MYETKTRTWFHKNNIHAVGLKLLAKKDNVKLKDDLIKFFSCNERSGIINITSKQY